MKRITRLTAAMALCVSAAGCNDFLTGPGLSENPNNPTTVALQQQFVAMEANVFGLFESQFARLASMYVQQLSGSNNQQRDWGSRYQISEGDINNQWNNIYAGGGLVDMRRIQQSAADLGDTRWQGIAQIYEAMLMGMMTSIFGDIAYSEAVGDNPIPALDPQQDVYAAVQTLLDNAINNLNGGTAAGNGPGGADLVFQCCVGSNAALDQVRIDRWVKVANTLKARFHMHTAEQLGAAAYNAAITAATAGISDPPGSVIAAIHQQAPGNFLAFHGNTNDDGNLWTQFLQARQDMVGNHDFITTLINRNDPRLPEYFDPNDGVFRGADRFGLPVAGAPSNVSCGGTTLPCSSIRRALNFRQPIVTWTENQLILAEAKFQTGGGSAAALPHVNAVRAALGMGALGAVTLQDIMIEKWIAMFQNIEAWNDYKRTCIPALTPAGDPQAAEIPGRIPYSLNERQNNPNVPLPSAQPDRNWNDPNAC
jgi:hypothetical protein